MSEEQPKDELLMPDRPKSSIKEILSLIPPASALKQKQRRLTEKRIRIFYDSSLKEDQAKLNPRLAESLGITDKVEVVVAGRHRFVFNAIIDDSVDENKVLVNPDVMEEHGVADGSIATVRAYRPRMPGG